MASVSSRSALLSPCDIPVRLAYLSSAPLFKETSIDRRSLPVLNTRKELNTIVKSLQSVASLSASRDVSPPPPPSVQLISINCSVSSFRTLVTLSGASIIHYGGHGDENDGSLLFEGTDGVAHPIRPDNLRILFEGGKKESDRGRVGNGSESEGRGAENSENSDSTVLSLFNCVDDDDDDNNSVDYGPYASNQSRYQRTKLAFVSACNSEAAGRAFVEAGVPHVIATTSLVRDESVIEFELQFYQSLFSGSTIRDAFNTAYNTLKAAQTMVDGSDENLFVLLGEGDHGKTALFSPYNKVQSFSRVNPRATTTVNLPNGVEVKDFVGRNFYIHNILKHFSEDCRLITIVGEAGVGKTSLAVRATRFSCERRSHFSRVNYVSFPELNEFFEATGRRQTNTDSVTSLKVRERGALA